MRPQATRINPKKENIVEIWGCFFCLSLVIGSVLGLHMFPWEILG